MVCFTSSVKRIHVPSMFLFDIEFQKRNLCRLFQRLSLLCDGAVRGRGCISSRTTKSLFDMSCLISTDGSYIEVWLPTGERAHLSRQFTSREEAEDETNKNDWRKVEIHFNWDAVKSIFRNKPGYYEEQQMVPWAYRAHRSVGSGSS